MKKFSEIEGKYEERSSEILADEYRNFFPKRANRKKFGRSQRNFSETGGKSETRGNASLPQGGGHPWVLKQYFTVHGGKDLEQCVFSLRDL